MQLLEQRPGTEIVSLSFFLIHLLVIAQMPSYLQAGAAYPPWKKEQVLLRVNQ